MKILITGSAGFIGFHTAVRLLNEGHEIVGLDNINDYYDVNLKYGRLRQCGISRASIADHVLLQSEQYPGYRFIKADLADREALHSLMKTERFDRILHLAAQAGVRYSIENPYVYINSNIIGTMNILEGCRQFGTEHLVYASSSSVYGLNRKMPFSTEDHADHPVSLYAATKKSNELMAHSYSHLYQIPTTGLRFFTVYGPWGRPDMAYYKFTKSIFENRQIEIYNHGKMKRDFTYIDDIVEGIVNVLHKAPQPNDHWNGLTGRVSESSAPYKIYNIGNNQPVELGRFVEVLENCIGKKANKLFREMQPGDVEATWADVDDLIHDFGFRPDTSIEAGLDKFVKWYQETLI